MNTDNYLLRFLGAWQTDSEDIKSLEWHGSVKMVFKENGELIYSIFEDNKEKIILLQYKILQPDLLITDQPSHPCETETVFRFTDQGKLVLINDGFESRYTKI